MNASDMSTREMVYEYYSKLTSSNEYYKAPRAKKHDILYRMLEDMNELVLGGRRYFVEGDWIMTTDDCADIFLDKKRIREADEIDKKMDQLYYSLVKQLRNY